MTCSGAIRVRGYSWIKILLFTCALLLLTSVPARAQSVGGCVANFAGVIDGFVNPVPPSQINIDGNCTIKNFPASNPLTSNISFNGTGTGWLVIFNNVDFIGNISCDKSHGNYIWFVNGSTTTVRSNCQNFFIPVEKIDKQNPAGQTTAAIGLPFTYKLTIPVLFDPASGIVINSMGSPNDLHSITVTDDLNATGASLSYVSHVAYWKSSGTPVPHSFSNVGGVLTFSNFPIIPAGQQIVIEITVVLNNDPANTPGTTFFNTATWQFGRLINGVFYEPLPGESGISPPMTIAAPNLALTKTGPATMNPGQLGQFGLNVQNIGTSDAWNATILDRLPTGASGGMCSTTPQVVSAQVFQADGVTPVVGKGPLVAGSDFSLSYNKSTCELTLTMLTAAATISQNQRLIINYRTQLDANSQNGATLTNVAGAIQWFDGDPSISTRVGVTNTLTDGTPGVLDFQDAHTVTVVVPALAITKQVSVVGGGAAMPGGQLDYLVHVTNVSTSPTTSVVITDDISSAGAGRLTFVSPPAATMNGATAGVTVVGSILTADYSTLNGPLQPGQSIDVRFRTQIAPGLAAGTTLTNTGVVTWNTPQQSASASVSIDIGETSAPNLVLTKTGPATMSPGQLGQFGLNVQNTGVSDAWNATILDRLPTGAAGGMCSTTPQVLSAQVFQADGVTPAAGKGPLVAGTDFSLSYSQPTCQLTLTMLTAAATISQNQRLIISYQTQLDANSQNGAALTNVAGAVQWFDGDPSISTRQGFTRTLTDGTPGILDFQDAHTLTVVISKLTITKQVSVVGGGAAMPGGQLDYLLHVTNASTGPATSVVITDDISSAGAGRLTFVNPPAATMNGATAGVTVVGSILTADYSTLNGPLQPGQSIDVRFRTQIAAGLAAGTTLTNTAVVTWNTPQQSASASTSIDIGGTPTPDLVVTKTGPATMSPGQLGQFGLNVQNTGVSDAWNATILDRLPTSASGGMCSTTPQVVSAQVFQADGVTPAAGKGPLVAGTDFSLSYNKSACELTLTMLTAAATISQNQRLIINYRTQLDANSQNGAALTNVAGAIQWFDGDPSLSTRQGFTHTLTDGTPGVLDFQDAHTVNVVVTGLAITKQVSVVGGGAAMPGGQLDYLVHVTNVSTSPTTSVVVTDDISSAGAGRLTFVNPAPTMNGATTGVTVAGSVLTADYSTSNGPLQPGQSIDIKFRVQIAVGLAAGTTLTNTAVVTWNTPQQSASASASIDIGGTPGSGMLNGTVWHDANFNKIPDTGEPLLQGWTVGLYHAGVLLQSVVTDVNGVYHFAGIAPTNGTDQYELRFTAPGAGANTAKLGKADSAFTNNLQQITDIVVPSGSNLQNLNLPIGPNGVVYNSMTRTPIAGATLTMLAAGTPLPASCFDDPAQQNQVTLAAGHYRFDVNFSDPSCPSGGRYLIQVTAPNASYVAGESKLIPATSDAATAPFSVPACPGSVNDALPAVPYCEVQASAFAAPASVVARSAGTNYYLNLGLDGSQVPGSSQIFNNHIPLDPQLSGTIAISKTTPLRDVTVGQLVPYVITVTNLASLQLIGVSIVDRMPPGFTYVKGSALLDGVPTEPSVTGLVLNWNNLTIATNQVRTLKLLLAVGAGVTQGEYVNRAQAVNGVSGSAMSGEATATVQVAPDPTFDCSDVFGKVFNDINRNGVQDEGEPGLAGVRVVTPRGLVATTDQYGRYHITCAIVADENRGSNFVLKLDDRTLPSGFRMSTNPVQIQRATSGKALRINFGASIYRVVSIDLTDDAFEPGKTDIRAQWRPRTSLLLDELHKAPSVLRVSYIADTEDAALVERRMQAFKRQLTEAWDAGKGNYMLSIEPEVFWRRGAPLKRSDVRVPESR